MDSEFRSYSVGSNQHFAWMRARTRLHWPRARDGDLDAASQLWGAYDDNHRAWLTAVCFRRVVAGRLSKEVGKYLLTATWCRESSWLWHHLEDSELIDALRLLGPGKPRKGTVLRIYRGVCEADDLWDGVSGLSWTTSLPVAAFFARRYSAAPSEDSKLFSCVFEANISAHHVLARFNQRHEQEVVVDPQFVYDAETQGLVRIQGRPKPIRSWGTFAIDKAETLRWDALAEQHRRAMKRRTGF